MAVIKKKSANKIALFFYHLFVDGSLLDRDEFIVFWTQTNFFTVGEAHMPIGIGMKSHEFIIARFVANIIIEG